MRWSGVTEARAVALAGAQHGVVSRAQLFELGISRRTISRRVKAKLWDRLLPGVFRLIREPKSKWKQQLKAVLLWLGEDLSAVSHTAAARIWEFDGADLEDFEVSTLRTRSGKAPPGITIHRVNELGPQETIEVDGLRVTQRARTLRDLAGIWEKDRLDAAMESAIRIQKTTVKWLKEAFQEMGARFRGRRVLSALIDEMGDGGPTDSEAERLFKRNVIEPHGLPMPVHNRILRDADGNFVAKPDFTFEAQKLVVEIYSRKYHGSEKQIVKDTARQNRITELGYRVLIFWWKDVRYDGAATAERIWSNLENPAQ